MSEEICNQFLNIGIKKLINQKTDIRKLIYQKTDIRKLISEN